MDQTTNELVEKTDKLINNELLFVIAYVYVNIIQLLFVFSFTPDSILI